MLICPVTKKCKFIVPATKNSNLSLPFCAPLAQGAKILTRDFMSGALRFAGVIREKPIFSKCILCFFAICKVTTSKFTAKLLLLSHSENYIKLTFVIVSHKIFLLRLFCAPLPAAPGGNCPLCPPQLRHWGGIGKGRNEKERKGEGREERGVVPRCFFLSSTTGVCWSRE